MVICLERGADLHMAQMMPLPLTVSGFSEVQIGFTFLVPAHPGSSGKTAVKRVCVTSVRDVARKPVAGEGGAWIPHRPTTTRVLRDRLRSRVGRKGSSRRLSNNHVRREIWRTRDIAACIGHRLEEWLLPQTQPAVAALR